MTSLEKECENHNLSPKPSNSGNIDAKSLQMINAEGPQNFQICVLLCNLSKTFQGKLGPYRVAQIKDKEGNRNAMFLNSPHHNKVKRFDIVTIAKFKKLDKQCQESQLHMLATLGFTKIQVVTQSMEATFENVSAGEHLLEGVIVGSADLDIYRF